MKLLGNNVLKIPVIKTVLDQNNIFFQIRIDHDLQYHIEDIRVMAVRSFFHHSELIVETGTLSILYNYKLLHTD